MKILMQTNAIVFLFVAIGCLLSTGCSRVKDDGKIRCSVTVGVANLEKGVVIFTSTKDASVKVEAPLGYGGCAVKLPPGQYEVGGRRRGRK